MRFSRKLLQPLCSAPQGGRGRRLLAAAGLGAGMLLNAPAALAIGEVFGVNLRTNPPQLRQFAADAPGQIGTIIGPTANTYAIDFNTAGTVLYAIQNTIADVAWDFGTIDLTTGTFTPLVPVAGLIGNPSGLSVDPTTEVYYVCTPTTLYTLDTSTGTLTLVGDFGTGGLMIDIAIDNSGNMYGHDISSDALYSIDKATGFATFIGGHGLAANFAQGMDFDPTTNVLHATIYTGGGTGKFVAWDTATGIITELADTTSFNVEMEMAIRDGNLLTGACCLPDGTCIQATSSGCFDQEGTFFGDGSDCSGIMCPQPGACCLPNFGCSIVSPGQCAAAGGTFQGEGTVCGSCPPPPDGVNPEVEPNDSKGAANGVFVMEPGDSILGLTMGSSTSTPGDTSADYFLVKTTPAPLGIYRHRLVITTIGTAGHVGTIRGLSQSSGVINPGTDSVLQTSSTLSDPPRHNQWYGFGKEEQIYYRVTGTSSTTDLYTSTLETTPVTPLDIGTYYNGLITIDRPEGVTTNVDFWVYDSQLNPILDYGNDAPDTLTRFYAPGTYYIAYSNRNVANDQPAASDDTYLTGSVTDFPNVVTNSSTALLPSLGIRMTDAFNQVSFPTPKDNRFDVVWLQFTVNDVPPTTGACCLPDGTCVQATSLGCIGQEGIYHGDNVDCGTVTCAQPGACCFPDLTCSILSAGQCAAAAGTYLGDSSVCGDCPAPPPGSVAVLGADSALNIEDVRAKLDATGAFPMVVIGDVMTTTPTLEYLQQFGAVIVWSNQSFNSSENLGNVLADYVDAGGGVVVSMFTLSTNTTNRFLTGRWDATYQIVPQNSGNFTGGGAGLGFVHDPAHPIMQSVSTFLGGNSGYRPTTTDLNPHGIKIAEWTDGKTLIAVSNTRPSRVDLGFFPPSSDRSSGYWDVTTDGARIMANALLYTMGDDEGCLSDWNGDMMVNSNDISAFLTAWLDSVQNGNLIADFNTDGFVNSNDISAFLTAWLADVQNGC